MGLTFSIIIPVYNVAAYLRACLDSVLLQTFADWECICVDDGSTDGSGEILNEYGKRDSRFKIRHIHNAGVGSARNVALRLTQGDYILFVDSDDIINDKLLEECSKCIDEYPNIDMVHFEATKFVNVIKWGMGDVDVEVADIQGRIRCRDFYTLLPQYAYSRSVFDGLQFSSHVVGEDLLFMMKCLCRARYIASIRMPLYAYRQRAGSAVNSNWTIRKLSDELDYRQAWISYLRLANREIEYNAYRLTGLFITEFFIGYIKELPEGEQPLMWGKWFESLAFFSTVQEFSFWTHCVIGACHLTKSRFVATMLCSLPHWLKAKGVHR